jgi:hypothetical protein
MYNYQAFVHKKYRDVLTFLKKIPCEVLQAHVLEGKIRKTSGEAEACFSVFPVCKS